MKRNDNKGAGHIGSIPTIPVSTNIPIITTKDIQKRQVTLTNNFNKVITYHQEQVSDLLFLASKIIRNFLLRIVK